jgi:hypothetical protein
MTPIRYALPGLLCLLATAATARSDPDAAKDAAPARRAQTYEDIEVMRRLLNRPLLEAYGLSGVRADPTRIYKWGIPGVEGATLWDVPDKHEGDHFPLADGVYLEGQGVVFTVSTPAPPRDPTARDTRPAAKVISPWEQTQRELRGEKVEPEEKAPARQPALADAILKVLADNGKNFRELPENESITVAVTFRQTSNCTQCHTVGGGKDRISDSEGLPGRPGGNPFGDRGPGSSFPGGRGSGGKYPGGPGPGGSGPGGPGPGTTGPGGPGLGGPQPPTGPGDDQASRPTEVQSNVLLGDLHLKQKEPKRAVEAYQKALELLEKELHVRRWLDEGATAADLQKIYTAIELYTKLAQAQVLAGQTEGARKSLGSVTSLVDTADRLAARRARAPAAKGGIPLPARLIVSAPKKLLDQVGSGKMTFDEFRKAAKVEYLKFSAPEKGEGV